jgi:hypothetical protein
MIKKTHWRVIKTDRKQFPWQLQSLHHFDDGTCTQWEKLSDYKTRKAAITVGMIMRDRDDPISWQGGAIRMGIALVESC